MTRRQVEHRSVMARAQGALGLSFLNTAVSRLGTLGIGIVLARLLGPTEFGTYAVATVALLAVLAFNELGVSLAIVRWQGEPRAIAPTVTTISVLSSTLLFGLCYLVAPSFSAAMGDPSATPVVRLLAISIIVNGIVATPAALLQRNFQQGKRFLIDQVNVWLGAILSILLAVSGMGAMSLAVGRLTGSVVSAVLFLVLSPEPYRFGFDKALLRPLLKFGLPLAGSSIIVFAVGYADQLVTGHTMGSTQLGYYVLAFNLASWPVSMFSQPLRSVAPAAFARLQHDPPAMREAMRSMIGLLVALTLPLCLVLGGAAEPIVRFVYGAQWAPAANALTWLAVLAAFRILFELVYDFLVVLGRSGPIFIVQLLWLAALLPALYLGALLDGIAGVAAAQVVVGAALILPMYLLLLRQAEISPGEVLRRVWLSVLLGSLAGAVAKSAAEMVTSNLGAIAIAGLFVCVVVAGLLYRDRRLVTVLREVGQGSTPVEVGAEAVTQDDSRTTDSRTT